MGHAWRTPTAHLLCILPIVFKCAYRALYPRHLRDSIRNTGKSWTNTATQKINKRNRINLPPFSLLFASPAIVVFLVRSNNTFGRVIIFLACLVLSACIRLILLLPDTIVTILAVFLLPT